MKKQGTFVGIRNYEYTRKSDGTKVKGADIQLAFNNEPAITFGLWDMGENLRGKIAQFNDADIQPIEATFSLTSYQGKPKLLLTDVEFLN
jgi:hypothetical protein